MPLLSELIVNPTRDTAVTNSAMDNFPADTTEERPFHVQYATVVDARQAMAHSGGKGRATQQEPTLDRGDSSSLVMADEAVEQAQDPVVVM